MIGIHIVMEFMGGEQPAASYIMRALANGKPVVTANKMALATHWTEIVRTARSTRPDCITKRAFAAPCRSFAR
ncbi:MAG: hypothetical protein ACLUI3_11755 [Christensenellales bacterium]